MPIFAANSPTMHKTLPLLFLLMLAFSCANESETTNDGDAPAVAQTAESNEDRISKIAPPPPVCVYLTEAEVLDLFDAGVRIPIPGTRSPGSFNSCHYTLYNEAWSGFLTLEMPEEINKVQAIRDEVAGAKGTDAVKVGEFNGRIKNDGRILSVEANRPFRVKFSALAKTGFPEPMDATERRELIVKLAQAVLQ